MATFEWTAGKISSVLTFRGMTPDSWRGVAITHFRLLTAISDRNENLAAFQILKESLQKDAQIFPNHFIGWQGGRRQHTVYWLANFGVWAVLEQSPPPVKTGPRRPLEREFRGFMLYQPSPPDSSDLSMAKTEPGATDIKRLFTFAGNRCAFPKCATPVFLEGTLVAKVCHIEGAKPGSARYDPEQSDEERHSYDNHGYVRRASRRN